jgi:uncharacterized OsmC-like protein
MTNLNDYLVEKRAALTARKAQIEGGKLGAVPIAAIVSAEGRSGIRRIRIRDFQVVTDSPPDFAGYNLGPSSPELQLGVLGSCLTHSYLIQAAIHDVPLDSLEVEVSGTIDARAAHADFPDIPVHPHDLSYTVRIVSSASAKEIGRLEEAVERLCPILNLLKRPQTIAAKVELSRPAKANGVEAKPAKAKVAKASTRPKAKPSQAKSTKSAAAKPAGRKPARSSATRAA